MSEITHKMKIGRRWVDVPNWAKWIAQDRDGMWWVYTRKPKLLRLLGEWDVSSFDYIDIAGKLIETTPPKDFTQELYKIERDK